MTKNLVPIIEANNQYSKEEEGLQMMPLDLWLSPTNY